METKKNNNILYTFYDDREDGIILQYSLNEWGGDKEAIYKDVVESFRGEKWVWKQKEKNGEVVYINYFHIKKREQQGRYIFPKSWYKGKPNIYNYNWQENENNRNK